VGYYGPRMRPGVLALSTRLVACLAGAAASTPSPGRAEGPSYVARLETGAEHDTNPARLEKLDGEAPGPIVASMAGRAALSLDVAAPLAAGQALSLSGGLATKAFLREEARGEDVLVAQASLAHALALGDRTALSLSFGYYDVFQRAGTIEAARDFRSVAPALRLDRALGLGRLSLGGGFRWFSFKPSGDFSFSGPTGALGYRRSIVADALGEDGATGADWEWSVTLLGELRRFEGPPCPSAEMCLSRDDPRRRRDHFGLAQIELTRTGDALVGAGAALHGNLSNSFGEELLRLLGHARAVVWLPGALTLSGRGELVLTRYADGLPLARNELTGTPLVSIEDEGRSTLRLELARSFAGRFEAGARYTLYLNAFASGPVEYRRQSFLLFVAAILED
jgi:hypothetical protein